MNNWVSMPAGTLLRATILFFKSPRNSTMLCITASQDITAADYEIFQEVTRKNVEKMDLYGDILFIHDPQPAGLIQRKSQIGKKWIWRCHIDISRPDESVWNFLQPYITQYDAAVFSAPAFSHPLPMRQFLISPSIDPLSDKNRELPASLIEERFQEI